jgi:uncharacterized membrane protein
MIAARFPGWRASVNRYAVLYLVTLFVIVPLIFCSLASSPRISSPRRSRYAGEIKPVPAILFYLIYVAGVVIFVSGGQGATWQSTLLYGALFGFFCYATFDLTSLALLKHWSWPVAIVDVSWGAFVTAVSSTAGLLVRIGWRRRASPVIASEAIHVTAYRIDGLLRRLRSSQ